MLKLILLSLFTIANIWANEPEGIFVISEGKMRQIQFKDLKKVEVTTINHHPEFKKKGLQKHSGYLVKDILSKANLKPDDALTIVGKTGQFSVELYAKELLTGENIVATHINGLPVETSKNGLQIIYSAEAIQKYPHLKQRQYWCWWVRSFITDEKFVPEIKSSQKLTRLKKWLPWPVPFGISSKGQTTLVTQKDGQILSFKKLNVDFLNGSHQEITNDGKTKYFLANSGSNKAGAYSLHQLIAEDGLVQNIVNNYFYVKKLEVIK